MDRDYRRLENNILEEKMKKSNWVRAYAWTRKGKNVVSWHQTGYNKELKVYEFDLYVNEKYKKKVFDIMSAQEMQLIFWGGK